jgi:hypothetical protein
MDRADLGEGLLSPAKVGDSSIPLKLWALVCVPALARFCPFAPTLVLLPPTSLNCRFFVCPVDPANGGEASFGLSVGTEGRLGDAIGRTLFLGDKVEVCGLSPPILRNLPDALRCSKSSSETLSRPSGGRLPLAVRCTASSTALARLRSRRSVGNPFLALQPGRAAAEMSHAMDIP